MESDNENAQLAALLKALGEPTRLRIFTFLRGCCCPVALDEATGEVRPVEGPTVGEVCCHVTGEERVTSTISEHCKELRQAGLILMEKRGRHTVCAVNPKAVARIAAYFADGTEVAPAKGNGGNGCC
jgi:ArsR family transcriptional regulator, arsenate/arsenite/antimonite-responsive transcriptional repressor